MTALVVVIFVAVVLGAALAAGFEIWDELSHPDPPDPPPDRRITHVHTRRRPYDFDRDHPPKEPAA